MIDASIIIVTYNTKDFTQRCLRSIYENVKDISIEVICVDNNSKDGTSTMIKKNFPEVILIENYENLGYARANNLGIDRSSGPCFGGLGIKGLSNLISSGICFEATTHILSTKISPYS